MQEADRHALDAFAAQRAGQRFEPRGVEFRAHLAARIHPFRHAEAQVARHQRFGTFHEDIVLIETVLLRHLDAVTKTFRGDQRDAGALALDDGVGRERGAVDDHADVARLHRPQHQPHCLNHTVFRFAGRGEHLRLGAVATVFQHHVGERPADVDSQARR